MEQKPLYEQIYDFLKQKIKSNEYTLNQQLPTELELAQTFGVSKITSKRALAELEREGLIIRQRGKGSFIKPQGVAEPDSEGLQSFMDKVISMILPYEGSDTGLLDYIRGATETTTSRGYYLTVHTTDELTVNEQAFMTTLPRQGVKGIIYYPVMDGLNLVELSTLVMNEYPIVTIDKYFEGLPVKYVVSDNVEGGYKLASHLIGLGHKKIAFISSISFDKATSVKNRYLGYCKALREHRLKIDSDLIITNLSHRLKETPHQDREVQLKELIKWLMEQGVTAIQAENDLVAIRLLNKCSELGIRVPDDLSIVGFDNTELSVHADIPLTSVAQDFRGIGRKAAELVIEGMEKDYIESGSMLMPVQLMVRQSSGPVPERHAPSIARID